MPWGLMRTARGTQGSSSILLVGCPRALGGLLLIAPLPHSMMGSGKTGHKARNKTSHKATHNTSATTSNQISTKPKSRSLRAGLQFPVGRVHPHLHRGRCTEHMGTDAPIYMAAVLEYLNAEMLELAGNTARDKKKTRINPRHLQLDIHGDEELSKLLGDVAIPQGGVLPNIQPELLPKKTSMPRWQKAPPAARRPPRSQRSNEGTPFITTSVQPSPPQPLTKAL